MRMMARLGFSMQTGRATFHIGMLGACCQETPGLTCQCQPVTCQEPWVNAMLPAEPCDPAAEPLGLVALFLNGLGSQHGLCHAMCSIAFDNSCGLAHGGHFP